MEAQRPAPSAVKEEFNIRLQNVEGCTSMDSAEGGILEVLLRELNEKGRFYTESTYLSNAVEKPDELKMGERQLNMVASLPKFAK